MQVQRKLPGVEDRRLRMRANGRRWNIRPKVSILDADDQHIAGAGEAGIFARRYRPAADAVVVSAVISAAQAAAALRAWLKEAL